MLIARMLLPGILLCLAVTIVAVVAQVAEQAVFTHPWLEVLVLAILIGTVTRTAWMPGHRFQPGIAFRAKTVLDMAVLLLGASISL